MHYLLILDTLFNGLQVLESFEEALTLQKFPDSLGVLLEVEAWDFVLIVVVLVAAPQTWLITDYFLDVGAELREKQVLMVHIGRVVTQMGEIFLQVVIVVCDYLSIIGKRD